MFRTKFGQNKKCFGQNSDKIRNVSDKIPDEIKAHILCSINLFLKNRTVYEVMWKNIVESGRPQMTVWRMRVTCWIPKVTNTHLEYVTVIAFPLQHWLHECASMLRYTYIACLVKTAKPF
jgi:hypothetical protein